MIKQYNITDYIKDDPELQKAVIKEFLNDIKRLQAENGRLKKELWQLQHRKMWNKEATLQAELLIKENERLKEEIQRLKQPSMIIPKPKQLAIPIEEVEKYIKALEEIREINKKWLSRWLNDPDERYGFEEIKSKINEVLKEQQ